MQEEYHRTKLAKCHATRKQTKRKKIELHFFMMIDKFLFIFIRERNEIFLYTFFAPVYFLCYLAILDSLF